LETIIIFDPNFTKIIEPLKPINKSNYICDNIFHVDCLLEQYSPELVFGIVVVSGQCSLTYKVSKTNNCFDHEIIKKKQVELQKRQKKGGSSAPRIGRIRVGREEHYVKDVAEMIVSSYMTSNNTKYLCEGLVVAGPSELKHKVMQDELFQQYFSNKVLKIIDCEMTENIIFKLIEISKSSIDNLINNDFKKKVEIVQDLIREADDKLVFGSQNIMEELSNCALEYLFVDSKIFDNFEEEIINLNTYGVEIIVGDLMSEIRLDMVGVKFW